jgi:hypothetical protein
LANIIDATSPVSINIAAQGLAYIINVTANPNPAQQGVTVTVTNTIKNTGATDTLWAKNYVNNVFQSTVTGNVTAGQNWVGNWVFTMPSSSAIVKVEAGHMVGTTQVMDDSLTITVTRLALPDAVFIGEPIYSPGQVVDPTTPVTITYVIQNTGSTGLIWGGLYDLTSPNPNLIAGYWEENINSGQNITKTVTIVINTNIQAQLLIGHFE